ncbi:hypothetical protein CHS0354_019139 [Potamilus streckersoni]|uniref:Uncharacterized protein n=1 Tax=Potamilus streckersoni TaxID=2493646 RepID=A0AAE0SZP4_9BIVA|nr:hypothetical protein CHS0354_019139 [Potamilus streckersoni]
MAYQTIIPRSDGPPVVRNTSKIRCNAKLFPIIKDQIYFRTTGCTYYGNIYPLRSLVFALYYRVALMTAELSAAESAATLRKGSAIERS